MKRIHLILITFVMVMSLCQVVECREAKKVDIFEAVRSGNIESVKDVLDVEPSALYYHRNISFFPGYTPLHMAAAEGDCRMVLFILERGISADIRSQDLMTPLHLAVTHWLDNNYAETIITLLKYKADVNALNIYRQTPLDIAFQYGDCSMVDFLNMFGAKRGKLFQSLEPIEIAP